MDSLKYRYLISGVVAGLISVSALAAQAQQSAAVERLIRGSAESTPLRGIDLTTRASKRYAIVIGNSNYAAIPNLPNALADARITAQFLKSQGYEVHAYQDMTKRSFEDMLRQVLFDVTTDTEVVVFFAGHGFQIGSENYLVPVDADLDSIYDVPFEAVSLGSLVGIIGARARLQIVILDSCRDNPFAGKEVLTRIGNELRAARTGFSSQAAPLNSMLIYSTSPGSIAFDGEGENSPFTAALVAEASAQPQALVKDVFERVRRSVYERTQGRQVPWDSSTLVEPASFGMSTETEKPISVTVVDGGESRGLARVSATPVATETTNTQQAAAHSAWLEVDFLPQVDIGPALSDALDLTSADTVIIQRGPDTGRLVLTNSDGSTRDVVGDILSVADVDQLVLLNESVQIPALSLENGTIQDEITVQVGGETKHIALDLHPDKCDFHAGDHLDPDGMGLTRYPNELKPELALAACEASIARDPDVGRYHYQLGRALVALKRNAEAKVAFTRARDLGHSRAWLALGSALLNESRQTGGQSDPKANEEVLQLYARGVKEGDPYAYYALGRQFMRFGGTPQLEIEGYDLMMRSLEVGHTFAMNELGYFYLDENGDYFDPERGLRYLRESAGRDDIYGFNNMGLVYARGLGGTPVDNAAAFDMYSKAAEGGHPAAATNLGWMYLDGLVVGGKDKDKAVEWFLVGLERGQASAGRYAARLIYENSVTGYDRFDAAVLGAKAAALSNQKSAIKARELIAGFSGRSIAGGTQALIAELGGNVEIDGAFGPASQSAMDAVLAAHGGDPAKTDPVERIIQLAEIVWKNSSFRVDLY